MKISNEALSTLLNKVKRTQTVGGKTHDQVLSCVLKCVAGKVTVTSLVKDGLTSVSRFSTPCEERGEDTFYITDIDTMLGVLKYHATNLTLTQNGEKLRIKSSNKQTTLSASPEALAYPHNPKTLGEWARASEDIASRLSDNKVYWTYKSEEAEIPATFVFKLDAVTLYEAIRCDSMNGQKINRYTFKATVDGLEIDTGQILKGKTKSLVLDNGNADTYVSKDESHARFVEGSKDGNLFEATFEGGLEHLLSHYNREIKLNIFDYTTYSQGWKMLFDFGEGDFVFQSSITR